MAGQAHRGAGACHRVHRKYAAFMVGTSLRLERLTWLDAAGHAFASTAALPRSGYPQFQP